MDGKSIVLIICLVLLAIAFFRIGIYIEKKDFNNGKCLCCGYPLRNFDTDSHGGRGYTCDGCGRKVWVSYPSVDKKFRKNEKTHKTCKTCLYNKSASSHPVCLECDNYNLYEPGEGDK